MATSTYKPAYTASATITIAPENVASSSSFIAGVESTVISNLSNLYADALVSGKWTAGTTPTINTQVQVWVYAPLSDDLASSVTYPDVLDGSSSAETMTSTGVARGAMRLAAILDVDATTSDRVYPCAPFSVAALFGGHMPTRWGLFITHNTGVNSNSTGGNHSWSYIGIKDTVETP
jgi:hypothetical protein